MTPGSCRSDGCDKPRRLRRGAVEPLCEDCYRRALRRVAAQLAAEETPAGRRKRFRRAPAAGGQHRKGQRAPERTGYAVAA